MARTRSEMLTEREAQIMEILWAKGPATAETIREALADQSHDSTVRTMLRVLKQKGYVRTRGRQPALYEPRVAREQEQVKAARSLLARFFAGSVEDLLLRLVEAEELSAEQLDQLRKSISQRQRKEEK
jgi:BlaI family penicillinase repressor